MLQNTTAILHARNVLEPTLSQLKKFIPADKILIIDDASRIPIPGNSFRFEKFSGRYEESMIPVMSMITTEFIIRVNGGDEIIDLREPQAGNSCWLSKIQGCPDHNMDASRYPQFSTSILSGSVIKKSFYEILLDEYAKTDKKYLFGACSGKLILEQENIERSSDYSLKYTSQLWRQR